jgi:hypothetical protein
MFIYVCDCIGLRNIVIMKYMYLAMLYPINDLIDLIMQCDISLSLQVQNVLYIPRVLRINEPSWSWSYGNLDLQLPMQ